MLADALHLRPLVLDGLTKRYGKAEPVLRDLDARCEAGAITAVVGPNGAGKSTLLRMLTAASFPTSGRVWYGEAGGGLDVHRHPHRWLAHLGVVHDAAALPEALTAEELLEWVARHRGTWDADAPARHGALLDAVRLDERRAQPVGTYSSGMRRKAQIAAALAPRPEVLVLDEPFRALDAASTDAARDLLAAHHRAGGSVILSSHRADLLEGLADAVLDLG